MDKPSLHEVEYPSSRRLTSDMGKIGLTKHHVKALLEVDVSKAWEMISQSRKSEKKIPMFAWLIKVIADCVALHPQVAGFNCPRRNHVLLFENVDISIVVKKEVNGTLVPLPCVIRNADNKTLFEIRDEIEAAKKQSIGHEDDYVLGEKKGIPWMKWFVNLPQWLRLILFRKYFSDPTRVKKAMGNVMITTVGMVGHTRGWIIPYSMHPLCLAFGSLNEQPLIHKGEIEKGRVLHLTVLFDHDVIDGMPAARFIDDLVQKLESGFGLSPMQPG